MEQMRADQAEDVDGGFHYHKTRYRETHGPEGHYSEQQVLEGDYEVREASPSQDIWKVPNWLLPKNEIITSAISKDEVGVPTIFLLMDTLPVLA